MKALMQVHGDVVVVHLIGQVDYESMEPFRRICLEQLKANKVVFNLRQLSFVGSQGITPFVQTFSELSKSSTKGLKFCAVGSEFRRIIEVGDVANLEIYDDENRALMAFAGAAVEPVNLQQIGIMREFDFDEEI